MIRTLLALALLLLAAGAFAAEPAPTESEAAGCPKEQAVQEKSAVDDAGKATSRPGTPAPVRPRATTGSRGTPRWHSLLPGMFR